MTEQCKVDPEDLDQNYHMKIGRKRNYIDLNNIHTQPGFLTATRGQEEKYRKYR